MSNRTKIQLHKEDAIPVGFKLGFMRYNLARVLDGSDFSIIPAASEGKDAEHTAVLATTDCWDGEDVSEVLLCGKLASPLQDVANGLVDRCIELMETHEEPLRQALAELAAKLDASPRCIARISQDERMRVLDAEVVGNLLDACTEGNVIVLDRLTLRRMANRTLAARAEQAREVKRS